MNQGIIHTVPCKVQWCQAPPGQPCKRMDGTTRTRQHHQREQDAIHTARNT